MKTLLALLVALVVAFGSSPARADAKVKPSNRQATIGLEANRVKVPTVGVPASAFAPVANDRTGPVVPLSCKIDPDVGTFGCRTYEPAEDEGEPEGRELTEGDILQAVREIGLPSLAVRIEPGDSTLVNARTNFYTDPEAFARSINLLGFDIDLEASPVRYLWVHGDGARASTARPGRPYPNLDVTHRYREPANVVRPRVDVTYRVRYRVDGGAWATLGETLTAPGPANDLEVNEAAPVLTAP